MYLCLDLSLKSTGWTKFTSDGKLNDKGKIVPDSEVDDSFKIHYITQKVKQLFGNVDELVIEDLFHGKNFKYVKRLARLSGAVIYAWVVEKYKIPKFYMASKARSLVGINARSQKAEVQIWVLDRYEDYDLTEYKERIKELEDKKANKWYNEALRSYSKRKAKRKAHNKYKYRMEKLYERIGEETGYGNDLCDSIILGLAYQENKNGN